MDTVQPLRTDGWPHDPVAAQRIAQEAHRLLVLSGIGLGTPRSAADRARHQQCVAVASAAAEFIVVHGGILRDFPDLAYRVADRVSPGAGIERRKARRGAYLDALTGLPGFGAFVKALPDAAADPECVLVSMDVDRFGTINKVHCNAAGDAFLIELAGIFKSVAAYYCARVFRAGGDEFYFLVSSGKAEALIAAAKMGLRIRLADDAPYFGAKDAAKTFPYPAEWYRHLGLSCSVGGHPR
jgi:GGDEF domain-containing protein